MKGHSSTAFIGKLLAYLGRLLATATLISIVYCLNISSLDGRQHSTIAEFSGRAERCVFGLIPKLKKAIAVVWKMRFAIFTPVSGFGGRHAEA